LPEEELRLGYSYTKTYLKAPVRWAADVGLSASKKNIVFRQFRTGVGAFDALAAAYEIFSHPCPQHRAVLSWLITESI
jgi:hypothetical protein